MSCEARASPQVFDVVSVFKESPVEITEVRIKLLRKSGDRLQAFCTITIDSEFVVRDLRIIQGQRGPFMAMPSRKLMDKCPSCSMKNEVRARFCNCCGGVWRTAQTDLPEAAHAPSRTSLIRSIRSVESGFRTRCWMRATTNCRKEAIRITSAPTTTKTRCCS